MPIFEYEIVDSAGAIGRGRQQAEDSAELLQQFRNRGQLVVSLRAADAPRAAPLRQVLQQSFRRARGRVRLNTLVLFTGQLAAMLEAGLHLVRILTALGRESSDRRFGKIVEGVRDSLSAGSSFAASLQRYPAVFSRLYVAAVRAGEASGALAVVLNSLTTHLEKAEQLRRKVKGALAYPITVLAAAFAIVVAMIVYIVPIFEGVYAKANVKLPAPTLVLVGLSQRALLAVERGVRNGSTLADMMQQTGAFTSLVTQLVSSGEEGGALAAMLGKAAVYYEAQVDASVATLSTLVEPVMILLLGGIAGSVILALYMPIFSLGQAMRGGIK